MLTCIFSTACCTTTPGTFFLFYFFFQRAPKNRLFAKKTSRTVTCRVKIFCTIRKEQYAKNKAEKKKTAIVEANCVVSDTDTVIVNCVALMNRAAALCVTRGGNHTSSIQQLHFGFSPSTSVYLRLPSPGKPCCHGFDMVSLFRGGTPPAEAQRSLSRTLPPRSLARSHSSPHLCRLPVL